jgi:hypothetical protein
VSKRSKTKAAPKPAATTHSGALVAPPGAGPETLRRMLLAVLTLVIVARPFVGGEDAGLLSDLSDPGGMVLTLLTFVACAGWAAWRLWAKQGGVHLGLVEIGLLLLAVLFAVGANFAPYARPALFTSAEWFGLVLLLFLTRQLATRPEEQHGLMTVLLATAVALSAQGVYQATYELPHRAKEADTPQRVAAFISNVRGVTMTQAEERQFVEQLERRTISGPFFRPASMATCLVLLLPLLGGAVIVSVRSKSLTLFIAGVIACALLAGAMLGLTRYAPAAAVLALAALPWLGLYWPARLGGWQVGLGLGLVAALAFVGLLYATGRLDADLQRWRETWPVAYQVGDARFWTGVGPGQFRFFYPRFMNADGSYPAADPSSSLLEVFAEAGVGGAVLLLVALALFFRIVARWWRALQPLTPPPPLPQGERGGQNPEERAVAASAPAPPLNVGEGQGRGDAAGVRGTDVRWEYYLGGMLAAILSFVLRANSVAPNEVMTEAFGAGLRSIVWFLAFALFERLAWSPGEYVGSLLVGVVALLLCLLVGPGLSSPAIASLLWVAVGLMLAVAQPEPASRLPAHFFAGLGLPALLGLSFAFFALVLYPASVGTYNLRMAKAQAALLNADRHNKNTSERLIKNEKTFIEQEIFQRLKTAEREDAGNVRVRALLATDMIDRWIVRYRTLSNLQGEEARETTKTAEDAVRLAALARLANPEGPEGYLAERDVHLAMAKEQARRAQQIDEDLKKDREPKKDAKDKKDKNAPKLSPTARKVAEAWRDELRNKVVPNEYRHAALALEAYVPRDPANPLLRYQLAAARLSANDFEGARKAAQEAHDLDRKIGPGRPRSLSDQQRDQVKRWLGEKSAP